MSTDAVRAGRDKFVGNDRVLVGIILGVLAFWLFAQTTLNIAPVMAEDLGVTTNVMNIAVSITALFSGIFIVVVGGLADRVGRVRMVQWDSSSASPARCSSAWPPLGPSLKRSSWSGVCCRVSLGRSSCRPAWRSSRRTGTAPAGSER